MNRYYSICGLLSSVVFLALWIAAAIFDPDWALGKLSLSDLGSCGIASAEICFNMGCALSGVFGIIFAVGIIGRKDMFRTVGILAMCCSILVISIGIIDLGYGAPHRYVATIYGLFATASMIASICTDWKIGMKHISIFTLAMLLLCAVMMLTQTFEIFEPIAISCVMIWTASQAIKFLMMDKNIPSMSDC